MTTAIPAEAFAHGDEKRYRRGCRCRLCTAAITAATRKRGYLRATGRGMLRAPEPAAVHIRSLRDAGMTDGEIRAAARIAPDSLYRILRGAGQIHYSTEQRILAVPVPEAGVPVSAAKTDGAGTRRRLQALVAAGWPVSELAARLNVHKQWADYLVHSTGSVELHTAAKVRQLFQEMWDTPPEQAGVSAVSARRSRDLANRNSWHRAAVWDDIDNPAEQPQYGAQGRRGAALVEDVAELAAHGVPRGVIAERVGTSWPTILKAFSRARVPIPETTE